MSIGYVEVNNYRKLLGGTSESHKEWTELIVKIIHEEWKSAELKTVKLYNMGGESIEYEVGRVGEQCVIFANARYKQAIKDAVDIVSDGIILATYAPYLEQLYINFDLFRDAPNEESINTFTFIMKKVEEFIWLPELLQNSWMHTRDKEDLTKRFVKEVIEQRSRQIDFDKRSLGQSEVLVRDYKEKLKKEIDTVYRMRRRIQVEEENINQAGEKLIKDLDLIAGLEKVTDLRIKDDIFEVMTDDIYCYTDTDKRYYIGKMRFTMNLKNTDVRFFNLNNPRQGWWTQKDAHPHVNGSNGEACLGSVATTIAELCARNELYALALTCIDFLENANTQDPAGAKVCYWDEVDEDGSIICAGGHHDEPTWHCDCCCDEMSENEEQLTAYNDVDDDRDLVNEVTICRNCRNEYYHYSSHFDAVVHDDINDEDYMEEEEEEHSNV